MTKNCCFSNVHFTVLYNSLVSVVLRLKLKHYQCHENFDMCAADRCSINASLQV